MRMVSPGESQGDVDAAAKNDRQLYEAQRHQGNDPASHGIQDSNKVTASQIVQSPNMLSNGVTPHMRTIKSKDDGTEHADNKSPQNARSLNAPIHVSKIEKKHHSS